MDSVVDLAHAAIVVAHPDDEILWFSSLAPKVGRIVMCYGAISPISARAANRRSVVKAYPLAGLEFLDLPIPGNAAADAEPMHRRVLADRLSAALEGVTTVFTHNPWGEYGQADHRRVHAAIDALQSSMNFTVYISCYVARHQLSELYRALDWGVGDVVSFPISRSDIDPIVALYRLHSCWTWTPYWKWPKREHFFRLGDGALAAGTTITFHQFGSRNKSRKEMMRKWDRIFRVRTKELNVRTIGFLGTALHTQGSAK